MRRMIAVTIVVLLAAGAALGEVYEWVDGNGTVTFKDYSPPARKKAKKVKVRNDDDFEAAPPSKPQQAGKARKGDAAAAATKQREPYVELYTTDWCGYCKQAVEYLRDKGINFVAYDIEKDAAAAKRKEQLDKRPGVPFALINGHPLHGFHPAAYESALKAPWKE